MTSQLRQSDEQTVNKDAPEGLGDWIRDPLECEPDFERVVCKQGATPLFYSKILRETPFQYDSVA